MKRKLFALLVLIIAAFTGCSAAAGDNTLTGGDSGGNSEKPEATSKHPQEKYDFTLLLNDYFSKAEFSPDYKWENGVQVAEYDGYASRLRITDYLPFLPQKGDTLTLQWNVRTNIPVNYVYFMLADDSEAAGWWKSLSTDEGGNFSENIGDNTVEIKKTFTFIESAKEKVLINLWYSKENQDYASTLLSACKEEKGPQKFYLDLNAMNVTSVSTKNYDDWEKQDTHNAYFARVDLTNCFKTLPRQGDEISINWNVKANRDISFANIKLLDDSEEAGWWKKISVNEDDINITFEKDQTVKLSHNFTIQDSPVKKVVLDIFYPTTEEYQVTFSSEKGTSTGPQIPEIQEPEISDDGGSVDIELDLSWWCKKFVFDEDYKWDYGVRGEQIGWVKEFDITSFDEWNKQFGSIYNLKGKKIRIKWRGKSSSDIGCLNFALCDTEADTWLSLTNWTSCTNIKANENFEIAKVLTFEANPQRTIKLHFSYEFPFEKSQFISDEFVAPKSIQGTYKNGPKNNEYANIIFEKVSNSEYFINKLTESYSNKNNWIIQINKNDYGRVAADDIGKIESYFVNSEEFSGNVVTSTVLARDEIFIDAIDYSEPENWEPEVNSSRAVNNYQPSYGYIGEVKTFPMGGNIVATCYAIGNYCEIYSQSYLDSGIADNTAKFFDEIYSLETNLVGSDMIPDQIVNRNNYELNGKVKIVVVNDLGSYAGVYYPWYTHNNFGKVLYVKKHYVQNDLIGATNIISHEFNHLLNDLRKNVAQKVRYSSWFTEMLSMNVSEIIMETKYGNASESDRAWNAQNQLYQGFIDFNSNGIGQYSNTYMFGNFLIKNFGGIKLVHELATNAYGDKESINAALKVCGFENETFDTVMAKYAIALTDFKNKQTYTFDKSISDTINGVNYKQRRWSLKDRSYRPADENQTSEIWGSGIYVQRISPESKWFSLTPPVDENIEMWLYSY